MSPEVRAHALRETRSRDSDDFTAINRFSCRTSVEQVTLTQGIDERFRNMYMEQITQLRREIVRTTLRYIEVTPSLRPMGDDRIAPPSP